MSLLERIISDIRSRGPLSVAEFMELALYEPELGYYAGAEQRSGRGGDFFTSVDVGPLFGEAIAAQLAEMWDVLGKTGAESFDLVEAGAGNGRLARDVMDAAAAHFPEFYRHIRLTLVERSAAARAAQPVSLGPHMACRPSLRETLPLEISGVILANELLDAFPVHVITRTPEGLREIVVGECRGNLVESSRPLSMPAVAAYLRAANLDIPLGSRVEVGLAAAQWIEDAARTLQRGFLLLFDYAHEPGAAYSAAHPAGTLTSYRGHLGEAGAWLATAGERDLTANVDLTAIRRAAEAGGLLPLAVLDQTYFLLSLGLAARLEAGHDRGAVARRLAARTLMMPGGLGSTMKVMVFAKGVGAPRLRGTAPGRLT
jgi:SAM-dependent MidA family methyltransferase